MTIFKVTEGTGDFEAFINARNLLEAKFIWAKGYNNPDNRDVFKEAKEKLGPLIKTDKSVDKWIDYMDSEYQVTTSFEKIHKDLVPKRFLPKPGRTRVHNLYGEEDSW